jgi:predicted SAM-dependent methyltransferase
VLDLRELNIEDRFDGILNWAGSFGYFSESENARLITAYVRALRPGGRLLIEQPNREYLLRHFQRVIRIGSLVLRNRWDVQAQRVITRRITNVAEDLRNVSTMRLYTPSQMRALFTRHGLVVEQLQTSLHFDAYPVIPRMVIVGQKMGPKTD